VQRNFQAALLTSAPFVIWGVLTVVSNVTNEVCTAIDIGLAGGESDMPVSIPCPDVSDSVQTMNDAMRGINDLTESINEELQSAFEHDLACNDLNSSV
jgi:hypothetical protein